MLVFWEALAVAHVVSVCEVSREEALIWACVGVAALPRGAAWEAVALAAVPGFVWQREESENVRVSPLLSFCLLNTIFERMRAGRCA